MRQLLHAHMGGGGGGGDDDDDMMPEVVEGEGNMWITSSGPIRWHGKSENSFIFGN